jgi:hypothetical protein
MVVKEGVMNREQNHLGGREGESHITNNTNWTSMEGILEGVQINELGSMEGIDNVVITEETSTLTFT